MRRSAAILAYEVRVCADAVTMPALPDCTAEEMTARARRWGRQHLEGGG